MSSDSQVPDSEPEFPSPNDNRASHQITKGSTFVSTTGTNIAIGVCGAIAALLAARVLGPQGRGELAAIQVWPTFLQVIAAAGMSEAISYFCARSPHQARQYLSTGLLISLSSASAFMIVGYFFLPIALHSKGPGVVHDAQAMLLIVPLYMIMWLPGQSFRGTGDYARWNLFRLLPTAGWMIILVGVTYLVRSKGRVVTPGQISGALVIETGLLGLLFLIVAYRRIQGNIRPERSFVLPLTQYGFPAMVGSLPTWLNLQLDQLIMASFIAPHQLGLYAVAVAWAQVNRPIVNALGAMMLPRLASEGDHLTRVQVFAKASRVGVIISIGLAVPVMLITPLALPIIFGRAFSGSIPSAIILVAASSVLGLSYILSEALMGLGRTIGPAKAQTIGLVVTVATLAVLLPLFGILGAALSSLFGYSTTIIWLLVESRDATTLPIRQMVAPHKSDLSFVKIRRS